MKYSLIDSPRLNASECLVLGLFEDVKFSEFVNEIDKKYHGLIGRLLKKTHEANNRVWQMDVDARSLLLINCGKKSEFNSKNLQKRLTEIAQELCKYSINSVTICLPQINEHSPDWQLEQMLLQLDYNCYQFLEFKTFNKKEHLLKEVIFYLPGSQLKTLHSSEKIAESISLTRNVAELPANICTPSYLGKEAQNLAAQFDKINVKIMGLEELKQMKMHALLAVAQGSSQEPKLIEISYNGGAKKDKPVILVGKGITFDSGGISLKPSNNMEEMKYDMCGAASVLGTMAACAKLALPINVIGILACAENMPSSTATKPGDIVTAMSGLTVEIINTDAEGRLVLADALTYAERFNPDFVIDIATLTGAVVVALGHSISGFMTENEELATLLLESSRISGDLIWRMPLDDVYQDAINSVIADIANVSSERGAGSVTAACFLSRFTKKYRWAHLDIAGTAWASGKHRIATGRPVKLLTQILRHVSNLR